jgi:hypothetical protein
MLQLKTGNGKEQLGEREKTGKSLLPSLSLPKRFKGKNIGFLLISKDITDETRLSEKLGNTILYQVTYRIKY